MKDPCAWMGSTHDNTVWLGRMRIYKLHYSKIGYVSATALVVLGFGFRAFLLGVFCFWVCPGGRFVPKLPERSCLNQLCSSCSSSRVLCSIDLAIPAYPSLPTRAFVQLAEAFLPELTSFFISGAFLSEPTSFCEENGS